MKPVKVLYIAGPSRSGSTFLSNILGELPGLFNAGEVIDLWDRGLLNNGQCSCSMPFNQCKVWANVLGEFFSQAQDSDIHEMIRFRDGAARSWRIPFYLAVPGQQEKMRTRLRPFLDNLVALYYSITVSTGCRVIVDASKNMGYAYLLGLSPDIELYCLHLIRDPRATAYSWRRKKAGLRQQSSFKTALTWISRNVTAGLLAERMMAGFMRLRYEDFVESPKVTVEQVLSLIQEEPDSLPFLTDKEVVLNRQHSIYGNPNRFRTGRVTIQTDDEWRRKIRMSDYLLVTALTWPLLFSYGYFQLQ